MWQQVLTIGDTASDPFEPGTPFALRTEGEGLGNTSLLLQSRRNQDDAEWSPGEKLVKSEIQPCFAVRDTEYRVVVNQPNVAIFWNTLMTSQADRK